MKTVAVIGASSDPHKYGNKAVRAFLRQGYRVCPINPRLSRVEGLDAYASILDVPHAVDMATFYVPPAVGEGLIADVAAKGVSEVWFNPGSESVALVERARRLGLRAIVACSIVGIGENPATL